jgi:hypothetical protein
VDYALRKRPHCKLVDTGLEFGVEGFKSFGGKNFDSSVSLTRRVSLRRACWFDDVVEVRLCSFMCSLRQ